MRRMQQQQLLLLLLCCWPGCLMLPLLCLHAALALLLESPLPLGLRQLPAAPAAAPHQGSYWPPSAGHTLASHQVLVLLLSLLLLLLPLLLVTGPPAPRHPGSESPQVTG
jgi:hypothetical protein